MLATVYIFTMMMMVSKWRKHCNASISLRFSHPFYFAPFSLSWKPSYTHSQKKRNTDFLCVYECVVYVCTCTVCWKTKKREKALLRTYQKKINTGLILLHSLFFRSHFFLHSTKYPLSASEKDGEFERRRVKIKSEK